MARSLCVAGKISTSSKPTFLSSATSASVPGRYRLEFDMVSEHLAWFEDLGSEVIWHELLVE